MEDKTTNPIGRPKEFKPEYCDLLRAFRARGYSISAFCSYVSISRDSFYRWKHEYPEFKEAADVSDNDSEFYFEKKSHAIIEGEIEASTQQVAMLKEERSRQHGVLKEKDSTKTEINIGNMNVLQTLSDEQLQLTIAEKLKKLNLQEPVDGTS